MTDTQTHRSPGCRITHRFRYTYAGPVANVNQRLVVVPPPRVGAQRLRSASVEVSLDHTMRWHLDGQGNTVAEIRVPRVAESVEFVSTVEVEETFTSMGLSNFAISFLSDDILRLRYVSINGQLRKMLLVVKMRGSAHSHDMHEYTITEKGVVIGQPLRGFRGLTSGIPGPWSAAQVEYAAELSQEAPAPPGPEEGTHE